MSSLLHLLIEQGPFLAAGATGILALGSLILLAFESPGHRRHLGELTLMAVIAWIVLVFIPLPRLFSRSSWTANANSQLPFSSASPPALSGFDEFRELEPVEETPEWKATGIMLEEPIEPAE